MLNDGWLVLAFESHDIFDLRILEEVEGEKALRPE